MEVHPSQVVQAVLWYASCGNQIGISKADIASHCPTRDLKVSVCAWTDRPRVIVDREQGRIADLFVTLEGNLYLIVTVIDVTKQIFAFIVRERDRYGGRPP